MSIHATAFINPAAQLGKDVEIGAFCSVGPEVVLGDGCVLLPHVRILGRVTIGRRNIFHPTSGIGAPPQDSQPAAPDGRIEIGDDNVFREGATVHMPKAAGGVTHVGSRNTLHTGVHLAHDTEIRDDVLLEDGVTTGGHAYIESGVHCGQQGGIHQFVSVGRKARVDQQAGIAVDVPPYMEAAGNHADVIGVNPDLPQDLRDALQDTYEVLYDRGLPRPDALAELEKDPTPEIAEIVEFCRRTRKGNMGRAREGSR